MINKLIYVKDKNNNINPWIVTSETPTTYKIESKCDRRYFTSIYKKDCYIQGNQLYCSRILTATSESSDYAYAPFYSFDLEEESTRKSDFNWTESES
ncbi:MAG TPA: hypothetical protein PK591_11450 [Ignavibacteriales bacterium]|nr:hypothetical protein [Ignavibacteriales bacterium]